MEHSVHSLRYVAAAALSVLLGEVLAAAPSTPLQAEMRDAPPIATQRQIFTDDEIIDGFFKITFGAEYITEGRSDRIRKFDGPIRVYIDSRGKPDRAAELKQVVADIGRHIAGLDIKVTDSRPDSNVVVNLVRDRDLNRTIVSLFGSGRARKIENSLQPQCLSGFRKDDTFRILQSDVILVVDAGDFTFLDCAYEEMLQALGPINDDETVPWSMFNDDVRLGFFGRYDQCLLNILYHPRIRPGMTRDEARAVVTEILPEVRAFVAHANEDKP